MTDPKKTATATVTVTVHDILLTCPVGKRLDDLLVENAAVLSADGELPDIRPCGGYGLCGRCRVTVSGPAGCVNTPTEDETLHLSEDELSAGVRLACRTYVRGDCTVYTRDRMTPQT